MKPADIDILRDVELALHDAYVASDREGKWSTVSEVHAIEGKATLRTLRELVSAGDATEKTSGNLMLQQFKPSRGLAGTGDSEVSPRHTPRSAEQDRGEQGENDRGEQDDREEQQEGDRQEQGGKPPPWGDGKPPGWPYWGEPQYKAGERGNLSETMGRGVGSMLVGGGGGSSTAAAAGATRALPPVPMQ